MLLYHKMSEIQKQKREETTTTSSNHHFLTLYREDTQIQGLNIFSNESLENNESTMDSTQRNAEPSFDSHCEVTQKKQRVSSSLPRDYDSSQDKSSLFKLDKAAGNDRAVQDPLGKRLKLGS